MDDASVVQMVLRAIEASDFDHAMSHLADGMMFSGATPEPVPADVWLGLHRQMNLACPDFSFNASHLHPHGDVIHVSVSLSGTQQNDLDLTGFGLPFVAATGKSFKLPMEELSFSVDDGMVTGLSVGKVAGGGVAGILSQLGVEMPH
jgi:hypothetical protein